MFTLSSDKDQRKNSPLRSLLLSVNGPLQRARSTRSPFVSGMPLRLDENESSNCINSCHALEVPLQKVYQIQTLLRRMSCIMYTSQFPFVNSSLRFCQGSVRTDLSVFLLTLADWPMASEHCWWTSDFFKLLARIG